MLFCLLPEIVSSKACTPMHSIPLIVSGVGNWQVLWVASFTPEEPPTQFWGFDKLCWHNFWHNSSCISRKKALPAQFALLVSFAAQNYHLLIVKPIFLTEIREIIWVIKSIFCLLSHSWDLGRTGIDLGLFTQDSTTSSVIKDGVRVLVFCFSFYSFQRINYAPSSIFLDVKRVNVLAIYLFAA